MLSAAAANFREILEHAVVVGRKLWYFLDYVPVLDDFAVFQAENIYHCHASVGGLAQHLAVQYDISPSAMMRFR